MEVQGKEYPSIPWGFRGAGSFLHGNWGLQKRWFGEHGLKVDTIRCFKWLMGPCTHSTVDLNFPRNVQVLF